MSKPAFALVRRVIWGRLRGATLIGLLFGFMSVVIADTYSRYFPTARERLALAMSLRGNSGLAALFGRAESIDTVGGYLNYKTFITLSIIGSIWAGISSTRLLRGEEDSRRWQYLLASPLSIEEATGATLLGLGVLILWIWFLTLALSLIAVLNSSLGLTFVGMLVYSSATVVCPIFFLGAGALISQLVPSRGAAMMTMSVGISVAFVLRMLADLSSSFHWLIWTTPFGWTEQIQPFVLNNLWTLVPLIITTSVLVALALFASARRDVGEAIFSSRRVRERHHREMHSPFALSWRLTRGTTFGWFTGTVLLALVLGLVLKSVVHAIEVSATGTSALQRLGAMGTGADQFVSTSFLFIAVMLTLVPASYLNAMSEEERSGRMLLLFGTPVTRREFFAGRIAIVVSNIVAIGVCSGLVIELGGRLTGVRIDFLKMLEGGVNVVPIALLTLSIGLVAFSIDERLSGAVIYAIVAWSFVAEMVGSLFRIFGGVNRLSIFHYIALAPSTPPNWTLNFVLLGATMLLFAVATFLFQRRDFAHS